MTMTTAGTQAIAPVDPRQLQLKSFLGNAQKAIADVAPRYLTAERLVKLALVECQKTPKLLECAPGTVLVALMDAARLGLEVGGALGQAYLVPYGKTCQMIPGYRGLVSIAWRSAKVQVDAHVVYENDRFSYRYGTDASIEHIPALRNRGDIIAAYAVFRCDGIEPRFEVMAREDIDAIRDTSLSKLPDWLRAQSPWNSNYAEMARKTAVRRGFKLVPIVSTDLADAFDAEDRAHAAMSNDSMVTATVEPIGQSPPAPDAVDWPTRFAACLTIAALDESAKPCAALKGDERKAATAAYKAQKAKIEAAGSELPSDDVGSAG
jgi:recombination protein RecT